MEKMTSLQEHFIIIYSTNTMKERLSLGRDYTYSELGRLMKRLEDWKMYLKNAD
jgi:hypothetical protein